MGLGHRSGEEVWGRGRRARIVLGSRARGLSAAPAGQFGRRHQSCFSLLRFLLLLNVLASVLTACMVLLPTWLEDPRSPCPERLLALRLLTPAPWLVTFATELSNLLSGEVRAWVRDPQGPPTLVARSLSPLVLPFLPQGFLEWSPLFYGFYPPRPPDHHLPVLAFAIGLLYLLLILHRSAYPCTQSPWTVAGRSGGGRPPAPGLRLARCGVLSLLVQSDFKMLHGWLQARMKTDVSLTVT